MKLKCEICKGGGPDSEPIQFMLDWSGGVHARCFKCTIEISRRKDLKSITREEALVASVQGE